MVLMYGIDTTKISLSDAQVKKLFSEFPQEIQDDFWEQNPPEALGEFDDIFEILDEYFDDCEILGFWEAYAKYVLNQKLHENCVNMWDVNDCILGVYADLPRKRGQFLLSEEEVADKIREVLGEDHEPVTVDWYETE